VFLADQAFESPGELRVPIVLSVRPGLCKLEVILVFQRSAVEWQAIQCSWSW